MKLHCRRLGSGQALLILHGLFGSSANWQSIARGLAAQAEVILVDLRNHGRSLHAETMSYADMVEDVRELLEAERIRDPVVLGHSMGGKVAMRLALTRPEQVAGLILVDIAPVNYPPRYGNILALMQDMPLDRIASRADADAWLAQSLGDLKFRQFLLQNLEFAAGVWRWRINLAAISQYMPEVFAFPETPEDRPYPGPALFINGALSNFLRPEHVPTLEALFPQAVIETLPNTGHWLHAEQPSVCTALIAGFLQRLSLDPHRTK